jgi:3-oxoacyl-[acyl-carrier protein] reductase
VLCARDEAALHAVSGDLRRDGGEAEVFAADLRDPAAPEALIAFAIACRGRLDILVNTAGATVRGDFLGLTDEQWTDGYALKLFGAVRLCRAAWPHLEASSGSILNIAGIGGRTPAADFSIGGSVNAALMAVTKSLADLGITRGIQVNAVNPGSIRTDRLQKRLAVLAAQAGLSPDAAERRFVEQVGATRIGEPDDIAALVAFVVGPDGRFLHGACIDIDGGATKSL